MRLIKLKFVTKNSHAWTLKPRGSIDILGKSQEIYEKSGAPKAREKISNISEDAREAWETSQNPWVYRISSVYHTITAESESGMTEIELRELDSYFSLEKLKNDVEC